MQRSWLNIHKIRILVFSLLILLSPVSLFAHPHVFIENKLDIVFSDDGLKGIRVNWVFDKIFSNMIFVDYDKNNNQKFEKEEKALIKEEAFSNLKDYNYFSHIKINKKNFEVKYIKDFNASQKEGLLAYSFFIPCHVTATQDKKEIRISIYDQTYYIDIALAEEKPVNFDNHNNIEYTYTVKEIEEEDSPVIADEITVLFKKKEKVSG
ncbi:DUF1007 family protein [Candidatus Margulisiibacteriota bacterium]